MFQISRPRDSDWDDGIYQTIYLSFYAFDPFYISSDVSLVLAAVASVVAPMSAPPEVSPAVSILGSGIEIRESVPNLIFSIYISIRSIYPFDLAIYTTSRCCIWCCADVSPAGGAPCFGVWDWGVGLRVPGFDFRDSRL